MNARETILVSSAIQDEGKISSSAWHVIRLTYTLQIPPRALPDASDDENRRSAMFSALIQEDGYIRDIGPSRTGSHSTDVGIESSLSGRSFFIISKGHPQETIRCAVVPILLLTRLCF
jgi:hypothetical protein